MTMKEYQRLVVKGAHVREVHGRMRKPCAPSVRHALLVQRLVRLPGIDRCCRFERVVRKDNRSRKIREGNNGNDLFLRHLDPQ